MLRINKNIPAKKTGYEAWKEQKAQPKVESKAPVRKLQYEIPYTGQSEGKKTYKWETETLKPLSKKKYGNSYEDKFKNWAKEQGIQEHEIGEFRTWLDAQEDKQTLKGTGVNAIIENMKKITRANEEKVKENQKNLPKLDYKTKKESEKESKSEQKKKLPDNWYVNAHLAVDNKVVKPIENLAGRFATNFADAFTLGQVKKSLKKHEKDNPSFVNDWASGADSKSEKVASGAGQLAGMFAPIGLSYKLTNPVAKAGYNLITKGQDLGKFAKYGQEAMKGVAAMGAYSTAREGLDELINPKDATLKERAKNVGMESALGFFGDPAARLLGQGIKVGASKGLDTVLKKMIPDDLPKFTGKASKGTLEQLTPIPKKDALSKLGNPVKTLDDIAENIGLNQSEVKKNLIPNVQAPFNKLKGGFLPEKPFYESVPKIVEPPRIKPYEKIDNVVQDYPNQELIPNVKPQEMGSHIDSTGLKERGHIETLRNSENTTESLRERLKGMYEPITNEQTVNLANQQIARGLDNASSYVKSAKVITPEHVATAHRLIQEFQKSGQIDRAVDMAEYIAEKGTKAGQTVQAFSIYDNLSPEGILVHAKRVADRANAKLNPLQKKVVIDTKTAEQLTDLATSIQKMTDHKTIANDIVTLMDKAKSGTKLTDDETKVVRQFYDDARQFVQDIAPKKGTPKPPKKFTNPATKEQVISFLDKQEEAARKRLAQRKGRALSGLPVDDFYDYTVIGASKLAKGTIHFAEFSEQMIKEFGEEVQPYMQQIYDKAALMVNNEAKRTVNRLPEVQKITEKAIKTGKIDGQDAENLRKFAVSIVNLSGDAKVEASQELQAVLQLLERPNLLQQISSAQTIAQLANPKTLVRNALGNELFYRLERINKYTAAPIDWARVKMFGGERSVTFRTNNQGLYWKNWIKGAKAGWKGVNPGGLTTQYDLRPNSFRGRWNPLTYMEKSLGVALKSFDNASYQRAVNNTIGELATLRAMNEGLTGQVKKEAIARYIREVDDNVLAIADEYGRYITFQDNNIFSVGLQKFKRGLNFGKDFGMGDLIIKYPRTPGALLMRSMEYSPAGFLKGFYSIAKPLFGKNFSTAETIQSFTRALIGTGGVTGVAWFLADKGIITGTGSKDFDVQELERMAGKSEYSINIDALTRWVGNNFNPDAADVQEGDHFITYNWALPISVAISIGANVQNNLEESGEFSIGNTLYGAADGAIDTMVEQSVLQGVKKAFESYPGQSVGDQIVDIAGDLPSSFVPTALNQVRQFTDNTTRNTYDPSKIQTFGNRALNKVPFFEKQLPEAYDTLGNEKEVYKDDSNNLFNVFLNPAFVRKYNPSPEAQMVLDIINDTGDTTIAPRRAAKYLTIDGKRYDLTPEQYSEYQQKLGEETRMGLQEISTSGDPEEVIKEIYQMLNRVGREVREELKAEYK